MTPIQKIRTSFTNQLTLWVAGFVLVTSGIVIFLLTKPLTQRCKCLRTQPCALTIRCDRQR